MIQRRRFLKRRGLHRAQGEVRQVIDQKCEDDETRPAHRTGSKRRLNGVLEAVVGAPGFFIFKREHRRRPDVEHYRDDQSDAGDPKGRSELVQELSVAVEVVRVLENLEVAEQMTDDEADQNHAGDGHDDFPADGGAEEGANEVHRKELQREWKRKAGENC